MGLISTISRSSYLKIIFPLANILCERRHHERRERVARKLTNSTTLWQQTGSLFTKPHNSPSHKHQSTTMSAWNNSPVQQWLWIIWRIWGTRVLPRHRTQTSDCPSCGDIWAWRQVHWGARRPDRGRLSWFLYLLCMRTPGNKISLIIHSSFTVYQRSSNKCRENNAHM